MHRLFSTFPGGWPGVALFLLRAVFGSTILLQGGSCLSEANGTPATWGTGLAAFAAGALLFVGFLTPILGLVVGLAAVGLQMSLLPACAATLFDSRLATVFALTMLVGIIILGPGAFSVDARVFGRREIIIPPISSPPR